MKILKSLTNRLEGDLDSKGIAYGVLMILLTFVLSFLIIGVVIPLIY